MFLLNAENVYDLFHVIQLANQKMDKDRSISQVNGERKKKIRYALLKNPDNLKEDERKLIMDIKNDNKMIGTSYEMNLSLRQAFQYDDPEMAKGHLISWIGWVEKEGSPNFRTLAKTVKRHLDGIVRAIATNINNGFQESLNGRVQFSKRLANGYRREMRLGRIVIFRQAIDDMYKKDVLWY